MKRKGKKFNPISSIDKYNILFSFAFDLVVCLCVECEIHVTENCLAFREHFNGFNSLSHWLAFK